MQKRKTGIALLLIVAMLLVPMVNALAEPVTITSIMPNGDGFNTTTLLTVKLSGPIEGLTDDDITVEDTNGNNIPKGLIGFSEDKTEITIPVLITNESQVKVTIKQNGTSIGSAPVNVNYDEEDDVITAEDFKLYITNNEDNTIGADKNYILFKFPGVATGQMSISQLQSKPEGAISFNNMGWGLDDGYVKTNPITISSGYLGQKITILFGGISTTRAFCKDNRVTLRDVKVNVDGVADTTTTEKITVTLTPGIAGLQNSQITATGAETGTVEIKPSGEKTEITIPITDGITQEGQEVRVKIDHDELLLDKTVAVHYGTTTPEDPETPDDPSTPPSGGGTSAPTPVEPEVLTELEAEDLEGRLWKVVAPKSAPGALNGAVKMVLRKTDKGYKIALLDKNGNEVASNGYLEVYFPLRKGQKVTRVTVGNIVWTQYRYTENKSHLILRIVIEKN